MITTIRTEQDAWDFLFCCWNDLDCGNDGPVVFDRCQLRIRLDPGEGKEDWKTTRAITLLQRHLNLTYLLAKRGRPAGTLSDFDRDRLSLAVSIQTGSTILGIDVSKSLDGIQKVLPAH